MRNKLVSVPVIFQELMSNEEFAEDVKRTFPEIEDSVIKYRANPHCRCKKEISKFFSESADEDTVRKFKETKA